MTSGTIPSWTRAALVAAVVCVGLCSEAFAEKRVALVIGNDRYANLSADQQLLKAVNDANTISDSLKRLGFEVILGTNLGRQGMIDRLADFTARLSPGDIAAVFFAGHGVAIQNVNYLVPSDVPPISGSSEARLRGASIAEPDLLAEVQAKSVRVALVVIDACRENPFPTGPTRSLGRTRGLAEGQTLRGVFKIYSAGENQTALDRLNNNDSARNSVFTRVFAEQMMRPELHLADLAFEVREKVAALAQSATDDSGRPAPHEQTPGYYDQTVGGRIFLAGRGQAVASTSQPVAPPPSIPVAPPPVAVTPPPPVQQQAAIAPPTPAITQLTRTPRPGSPGERCARNGLDTYCVSSVLPSQFGNSYGPQNLFSGGQSVAWVEGRSGQGIGEWITVEFDTLSAVNSILLRTGYQKNADIFDKNSRVRQLKAEFSGGQTMTLRPADQITTEAFRVDPPIKAHWIKFTIEAVYPGSKYSDTAITKLNVQTQPIR